MTADPFGDEPEGIEPEPGFMDEKEAALAVAIYEAIQDSSRFSERGMQSAEFRLGVSDMGYCSERARRMLNRQEPDEDVDLLKAFLGTHIGDGVEEAVKFGWPNAIIQSEVSITLRGELNTYTLPGHPDIILPEDGVLLDGKTSYGLGLPRRTGMVDQQKMFQRHLYGMAAFEDGMFGDIPFEDIKVGNVWIDRAGVEQSLHVKLEPLSVEVVEEAARWLDSVVYAWQHNEEAMKEPAREVCATTCGYFRTCREWQSDATGLLEDPRILTAVEMYTEGHVLEKRGKAMKDQAKDALRGVRGTTREFTVRWTDVGAVSVKAGTRKAHQRLEVKKIAEPKPAKRVRARTTKILPASEPDLHQILSNKTGFDSDGNAE